MTLRNTQSNNHGFKFFFIFVCFRLDCSGRPLSMLVTRQGTEPVGKRTEKGVVSVFFPCAKTPHPFAACVSVFQHRWPARAFFLFFAREGEIMPEAGNYCPLTVVLICCVVCVIRMRRILQDLINREEFF